MDAQDPVLDALIDRVHRARSQRTPLEIRGGGTKAFYGGPARGEPLEMSGLAGISLYEPTELVVTVRAGTPLAELEAALAASRRVSMPAARSAAWWRRACRGRRAPISDRFGTMCWG